MDVAGKKKGSTRLPFPCVRVRAYWGSMSHVPGDTSFSSLVSSMSMAILVFGVPALAAFTFSNMHLAVGRSLVTVKW